VHRAQRYHGTFSLIFMDVDHFKHYNDTQGHLAGDEVLRTLGLLLLQEQRATTTAARYGGEEFVLMLPEAPKAGARALAEKVRTRVEAHPFAGREAQPAGAVTISAGVAAYPEDGSDANTLIEAADRALYEAKHSGRNKVR
jgi:diguanylate cyclase (GGDEF)-like protein